MSNNTDSKYTKLGNLGYIGAQEDRELSFYRAAGILSTSVTDAESSYLNSVGFTTGSNEDRWKAYLISLGYTGSVDDMLPLFWKNNAGGGAGAAFDPYFAAVTLLLNFDGGYTDSSSFGNTVNNSGCSITASPVKFGSGALQTNGTSPGGGGANNISTALSSQFGICSGDFTIECFAYLKTSVSAVYSTIFRLVNGLGVTALRYSVKTGSDVETSVIDAGGSLVTFATTTDPFTLNTWHHVAITRSGTTVYIFLDGVVLSASTISVPTAQELKVIIGNQSAPGSTGWDGYIDEFRITRSFARYTANFTPPAVAFPNS